MRGGIQQGSWLFGFEEMTMHTLRCGIPQGGHRLEGLLEECSAGHVVFSTPVGRCLRGSNAFSKECTFCLWRLGLHELNHSKNNSMCLVSVCLKCCMCFFGWCSRYFFCITSHSES